MRYTNRPLCKQCNDKPRAYAYTRNDKTYWRRLCDSCIRRKNNLKTNMSARWIKAGYKKKKKCELCGFKSQNPIQMNVYHVDGNRNNNNFLNLKTICANCQRLKSTENLGWIIGDLEVDG